MTLSAEKIVKRIIKIDNKVQALSQEKQALIKELELKGLMMIDKHITPDGYVLKVGDVVKIIDDKSGQDEIEIGSECLIVRVDENDDFLRYLVQDNYTDAWVSEADIALVNSSNN